jgi:signal transduction histidine kinase
LARFSDLRSQLIAFDRWLPDLLRRPWFAYAGVGLIFLISLGIRTGYVQTVFSLYLCVSLVGGYFGGFWRGMLVTMLGTLGLVLAARATPVAGEHMLDVALGAFTFLLIGGLISYLSDQGLQGLRQARALSQTLDAHEQKVAAANATATQATAQLDVARQAADTERRARADTEAAGQRRVAELESAMQALREQLTAEREAGVRALGAAKATSDDLRRVAAAQEEAARKAASELVEARQRLAQLAGEQTRRDDERRRAETQAQQETAAKHEKLRTELAEMQARNRENDKALAEVRQTGDKLQQEVARRADEAQRALAAQRQAEQKLQELQAAQEKDQAVQRVALADWRRRHDEASSARDQLQTELTSAHNTLDTHRQRADVKGRELNDLREKHTAAGQQLTELQRRHDEAAATRDALGSRVRELEENLRRLGNDHGLLTWLTNRVLPALTRAGRAAEVSAAAPLHSPGRAFAALVDDAMRPALNAFAIVTLAERLGRGEVHARLEPIELEALVRGVVDAVDRSIASQGQHLTVKLPLGPQWLRADAELLTQALTQLLNNAANHAGRDATIELTVVRVGERMAFAVQDDGLGLPAETVAALPQLSIRAGQFWSSSDGTVGLGLALARDIADLHHGCIRVVTSPQRGLVLELPVAIDPQNHEIHSHDPPVAA